MNVLAGLTGTAWGGMAIVLNAFGGDFMRLATEHGIYPDLMQASKNRVTNLTVATLETLVICPTKKRESEEDGEVTNRLAENVTPPLEANSDYMTTANAAVELPHWQSSMQGYEEGMNDLLSVIDDGVSNIGAIPGGISRPHIKSLLTADNSQRTVDWSEMLPGTGAMGLALDGAAGHDFKLVPLRVARRRRRA